jgi:hypothetical protein
MTPLTRLAKGARAAMPRMAAKIATEASMARATVLTTANWLRAMATPTKRIVACAKRRTMRKRVRLALSGSLPSSLVMVLSRRARSASTTRAVTMAIRTIRMARNQGVW